MGKAKRSKNGGTVRAMGSNGPAKGRTVNMLIVDEAAGQGEAIGFEEKPKAPAPTPAQVLEELQAQLAEGNLPAAEVESLLRDPVGYLALRLDNEHEARQVVAAVAKLYFATLHKKATEGEAFTEARVVAALRMARARTLEALAQWVQQSSNLDQVLRVAELVSKD